MTGYPCPECCNPTTSTGCTCYSITTTDCARDASIYTLYVQSSNTSNCTQCSDYNGVFDLCWNAVNSRWESTAGSTACGRSSTDSLYTLQRTSSYYEVEAVGTGRLWRIASSLWTCLTDKSLVKVGLSGTTDKCANIQATVGVAPCIYTCNPCTDTVPRYLPVTFSGFSSGYCSYCSTIYNATFLLEFDYSNIYDYCKWIYNRTGVGFCSTTSTGTSTYREIYIELYFVNYSTYNHIRVLLRDTMMYLPKGDTLFFNKYVPKSAGICSSQYILNRSTENSTLCITSTDTTCQIN